jgi:hypothetical protein
MTIRLLLLLSTFPELINLALFPVNCFVNVRVHQEHAVAVVKHYSLFFS